MTRTGHILVADDEESIRWALATALTGDGHTVEQVDGGEAALASLRRDRFDLAFVDIRLGAQSGLDVLRLVRERLPLCPVVMVTGSPTIDTAAEALRHGAFDYIVKPVRQDALLRVSRIDPLDAIKDTGLAPRFYQASTSELYGGDMETRIQQEILLGIGGIRALRAFQQRLTQDIAIIAHHAQVKRVHPQLRQQSAQYRAVAFMDTTGLQRLSGLGQFIPGRDQRHSEAFQDGNIPASRHGQQAVHAARRRLGIQRSREQERADQARPGRGAGGGDCACSAHQGDVEQRVCRGFQRRKKSFRGRPGGRPRNLRGEAHLRDCQVLEPRIERQDTGMGR
jgi:CheY-like chemotaxis protein